MRTLLAGTRRRHHTRYVGAPITVPVKGLLPQRSSSVYLLIELFLLLKRCVHCRHPFAPCPRAQEHRRAVHDILRATRLNQGHGAWKTTAASRLPRQPLQRALVRRLCTQFNSLFTVYGRWAVCCRCHRRKRTQQIPASFLATATRATCRLDRLRIRV